MFSASRPSSNPPNRIPRPSPALPQWPGSSFVLIDAAGRRSVAGPHRTRRFIRPGRGTMTNFDLTDEEKLALAAELRRTIADDRYPLSPRVRTLQSILDKLDPRPAHDPAPPLKRYEPPWKGRVSDTKLKSSPGPPGDTRQHSEGPPLIDRLVPRLPTSGRARPSRDSGAPRQCGGRRVNMLVSGTH